MLLTQPLHSPSKAAEPRHHGFQPGRARDQREEAFGQFGVHLLCAGDGPLRVRAGRVAKQIAKPRGGGDCPDVERLQCVGPPVGAVLIHIPSVLRPDAIVGACERDSGQPPSGQYTPALVLGDDDLRVLWVRTADAEHDRVLLDGRALCREGPVVVRGEG